MTAEAEAADEERQNLCLEVLQLYGDPEVFGLCSSLSQERRRHFLSSFQDFLEDKYRDLFLLATSRLRGHPVLGKPDVKASKTPGFEPSIATIRRCRRGSPQSVLYPPGAFGITRPLQVLLGPAVGRTDPTVIQEMEVKHIPQFGKQAWGHDLFEKQKELASELWRSSAMGSSPHLTELVRRRPCGQRDSGQRIAPGKLARIQASEITPFFYPEEAAACSITLVTDPATSPTGQIMTIARDGEGALERVFLDNQLPAAGAFLNDVAQARFAKGNKLDIMEPILVVHRDGLRGIAVRPDEARRLVTLGIHPADARAMGNKAVASQQYWAAAEFYCAGLQHAEMDIIATLLSNRCQAYLKTREYAAAVCDAAAVLQMRFHEAKAWARYAQALRGLGAELLASRVDAADDDAPSFTEASNEMARSWESFLGIVSAGKPAIDILLVIACVWTVTHSRRALETTSDTGH